MLAIAPELFDDVRGSTDTEVVFNLALTHGLQDDPIAAMERTLGLIEELARRRGVEDVIQGTFGISDGETLWAVRYATGGNARSLYMSTDSETIRRLYPDNARFQRLTADDRLVVSEPFSDLPGVWEPVPEATAVTVRHGGSPEQRPFTPAAA
jgi:glutamine amidotransferase